MFKGDNQVPLGDICNIEKGATITRNDVLPGEVPATWQEVKNLVAIIMLQIERLVQ